MPVHTRRAFGSHSVRTNLKKPSIVNGVLGARVAGMFRVIIAGIVLLPGAALAAPRTLQELAGLALVYIDAGIGIAFILGIVIYFYGVATAIPKLKSDDSERLKAHFLWGILALFIMFSVWGILALLRNTLFAGGGYSLGSDSTPAQCASFEDCVIGGEGGPAF